MNSTSHAKRAAIFMLALLWSATSLAIEWPQEISGQEGTITVYQPQPEKLEGNLLSGRAAISLETPGMEGPVFGAMFFTARIDNDSDSDIVLVRDLKVSRVTWPDSSDAGEQRFTAAVEGAMPDAGFEISMERLAASLENAEIEKQSLEQLKSDPPKILFSDELAVLLLFDGEPKFSELENTPYERVVNTPFAVACDKKAKSCYLSSGAFWYQAKTVMGPWTVTSNPPADLAAMIPQPEDDVPPPASPPKIVVATEPTELISTDGKPNWTALTGGELLYVSNTESPWLRELATNNMYLLLSGRWYRSKSQDGPWTFVRADELPVSFKDIPPASDIGGLRTSVAGTDEAEQAMLEAAVPETAAIKRSEAKLEVEYDGSPKFEKINGTEVSYAVNTAAQVLLINNRYYAVDNGVWFTSSAATGPWVVADSIPDEQIQQIPPSAPVYNTTYVQVYESTPEIVYVGYRPGYLWSFPYYGVPVYGTGWYYPPYWGGIYYPRVPTWGFHVGYNPWTGWTFGLSWSNGFFRVGIGWGGYYGPRYGCCGGWYGGGYRRPVVINTGDINIGNNVNIGNRNKIGNQVNISDRSRDRNIYNRPENRARKADTAVARRDLQKARPSTRENNVFADRNGNVARRNNNQWETRDSGSWKSAPSTASRPATQPSTRPATRPSTQPSTPASRPATRPSINQQDLNRSYNARQTGRSREMSSRSRPAPRRQR
jgi:hypothetical protein